MTIQPPIIKSCAAALILCVLLAIPAGDARADNQIIVESKTVPIFAHDVVIHVRINNDQQLDEIILPLELRTVTGGAFVDALKMSYAERLAGDALTGPSFLRRFPDLDFSPGDACNLQHPDSVYSFSVDGSAKSPITSSPEGLLFLRAAKGAPLDDFLEPGFDLDGSIVLTADMSLATGTFEIDTTCAAPSLHPSLSRNGSPFPISFTKGTITVVENTIDTIHVSTTGHDEIGDGSILFPYRTIQKAIEEAPAPAASSAVIVVHPGTYTGPIVYPVAFGLTIVSTDGAAATHIIGTNTASVVRMNAGTSVDHQILDGFTIRDNNSPSASLAGGITVNSPTWADIRNCIVRNNTSLSSTGGIEYHGSEGVITNTWIVENTVEFRQPGSVAGVLIDGESNVEFVNNTIANNQALGSSPFGISGVQIGGVNINASGERIVENVHPQSASANDANAVLARFDNNCIAFNGPTVAYSAFDPPTVPFYNCLYAGNGGGNNTQGAPFDLQTLLLQDPEFADTANGDFHLTCTSPAIDGGRVASVPSDIRRDIDGQSRFGPFGQPVDIGADEYAEPLPVDFTHTVLESNCQHLVAEFTALDDPGYTGYTWYFGDGDSATGNPVEHEYTTSGLFPVQLRVTTICEPDSILKKDLIHVVGPFTADFDADQRIGCDSLDVVFTGTATADVDTFIWDYGDDSSRDTVVVNGTVATALHHYVKIGKCTVTLFAVNECGPDTVIKEDFIEIRRAPKVFITSSYDDDTGTRCNPYTVEFAYTSTAPLSSFVWEFGDDSTSTEPNPTHTYLEGGHAYSVRLTATGECGTDVVERNNYIALTKRPVATLNADATTLCVGETPVTLSASVDGSVSTAVWQFGDGDSATGVNVQHAYDAPGDYVPRFIMTHGCGADTVDFPETLSVGLPPVAAFAASTTAGYEPLEVTLTDHSANAPTAWSWDFGDGDSSDESSPVHTYDTTGVFAIRLAISNPCGADTAILAQSIRVGGFSLSLDSSGVDGDTILYSVDVDTSVLAYDNTVNLSARLTTTPPRGSMSFAVGQGSGLPPFATTMYAIPSPDLSSGSYVIELSAADPARITKTQTASLQFKSSGLLSVSVDTLHMDSTIVTTASSKTITIRNNAPALSGLRVQVQNPNVSGSSVFSVQGSGQSIAPQQELRWSVLFEPRVKGTFSTTLRIFSDDPARPELVIPIIGRGIGEQSPPRLISSSAGELRIDQPILFEFNEPIIPDLSDTFLIVRSGHGDEVAGQRLWTSNRALRFTAEEFLPYDDTLSVLLRAVFTDTNGNYFDGNGNGSEERSPVDDAELAIPTGPGVYPGDADNNGSVDERDVLALGRYYGLTGDARPTGDPGFTVQPATAWDIRGATYADADGSGKVDSMDICPIAEFFDRDAPLPKAIVEAWLNEAQAWSGDIISALRSALADCPNGGAGQETLQRFLDGLNGGPAVPTSYRLEQNYPNPFNPSTLVRYDLSEAADVRLDVYDITGRLVRTLHHDHREPGTHNAIWDGRDANDHPVASGIYFYRLTTPHFQETRKMVLLK